MKRLLTLAIISVSTIAAESINCIACESFLTGKDQKPNNLACETGIITEEGIPGLDEVKLSPCSGMCFSEITGSEVYRGCMNKEDLTSELDYSWVFGSYNTKSKSSKNSIEKNFEEIKKSKGSQRRCREDSYGKTCLEVCADDDCNVWATRKRVEMVRKAKLDWENEKPKKKTTQATIKKDTEVQTPLNTPATEIESAPKSVAPPLVTRKPVAEKQSCILGMFCSSGENLAVSGLSLALSCIFVQLF